MKYILVFIIKVIGLFWIYPCIYFRAYARNVVYTYILERNKYNLLGRLWERKPVALSSKWALLRKKNIIYGKQLEYDGFIKYRKVSAVKFYLVVFFIWGWLDDDANHDTTDLGYMNSWLIGERSEYFIAPVVRRLIMHVDWNQVFGNTFDLGDVRAEHPFFNFWCTFFWNMRNTGMNFKYLWMKY